MISPESDLESDRLWNAWQARALNQGRVLDRRFKRLEMLLGSITVVAAIVVTWFGWW